ncbi:MAG TPA: L-2-hydroxyglutarate oxidase, partial [Gaiellaceae bacterium]|nr:L-2-hydroxyglutarate oxidase [Gaiellaceae bacterium]
QLGLHQSGRNSGVVHAGVYYAPGSLKAQLCREGRAALRDFAEEHDIPYTVRGKVIVATSPSELPRLDDLKQRADANGVQGARELDADELRELEPHVAGFRALHVPESAVIDFKAVLAALADDVRARGGEVLLGRQVERVDELAADRVVVCAGLQADRLAHTEHRIVPFRGDYFVLRGRSAGLIRTLVYPVPDPAFPFLGVHFTRRHDEAVWAGPNAVPSLARERYRRFAFDARDARELAGSRGLWRLARRYWRTGALELWRDIVKRAAVHEMQRYVPDIDPDDVAFGPCGIRAQVVGRDGTLVDDFLLEREGNVLHVVNAPSPAATASLAIGARIADAILA